MQPAGDSYAELEIALDREHDGDYQAEIRFVNPLSAAEVNPARGRVRFDLEALRGLESRIGEYCVALSRMLFDDVELATMFRQVEAVVGATSQRLRVRLRIGVGAPELHGLRWELLAAPDATVPLFLSDRVLFSRYMMNQDWRTVSLRPKMALRALVAVSAPSDIEDLGLAGVDAAGEVARVSEYLQGTQVEVTGLTAPLTLTGLVDRLRTPYDILYLVCHGRVGKDGPTIYLQNADGTADEVPARSLAAGIGNLPDQPRLAVLASCQSAGGKNGAGDPAAALAPMLAAAGVTAIVAMRGNITLETIQLVAPMFFRELLTDGQVDRAMAVARERALLANRFDYWAPTLYMRLRGGRLWYEPGFTGGGDFEKWQSITRHVRDGRFVAITGSGLGEWMYGDSRNLAREIASAHRFPMAEHKQDDLPQVCQYLAVTQDPVYARKAVLDQLRTEVLRRHSGWMPPELQQASLPRLLDAVLARPMPDGSKNPYQILAGLPGSVYVSATADPSLAKAIKAADRQPQVVYSNWRRTAENTPAEPVIPNAPTPGAPVVYQMLGVFGKDESLVMTENDYFDYLIATTSYRLVPSAVRSALVENSLLFLGFHLDDWNFRVLFRLIQSLEGGLRNARMAHVGVQVNPDEYSIADVERARRYLEQYFDGEAHISLYWGSAAEFLQQLDRQYRSVPQTVATVAVEAREEEWHV